MPSTLIQDVLGMKRKIAFSSFSAQEFDLIRNFQLEVWLDVGTFKKLGKSLFPWHAISLQIDGIVTLEHLSEQINSNPVVFQRACARLRHFATGSQCCTYLRDQSSERFGRQLRNPSVQSLGLSLDLGDMGTWFTVQILHVNKLRAGLYKPITTFPEWRSVDANGMKSPSDYTNTNPSTLCFLSCKMKIASIAIVMSDDPLPLLWANWICGRNPNLLEASLHGWRLILEKSP